MKAISNPFEFEAANNLKDEDIIKFYIEDHNYTRFIRSTKNIFTLIPQHFDLTLFIST